ncbi:MAG: DnaD domain protein [Oscillospiraceae bacterium]|jgi:DnaD/phage-associated family protein|nr:DnaD domain protein [Oscillospiraceae bacterium]
MAYYLENGVWSAVFAVPCDVVDKHIKLCSPLSLKVLMVVLRQGGGMDIDQLAGVLGQSRADVQDAINYWIDSGIIHQGQPPAAEAAPGTRESAAAPREQTSATAPSVQVKEEPRKIENLTGARPRLTTQEINEIAQEDKSIGYLLQESQQIMGKPLTPVVTEALAALYSYYGMQPDLILMLVQYCVSIGKDSVRYIEKVAASWMERDINTHERAETEILRLTSQKQDEGKMKRLFGISDRALVSSERKYIETWVREWNMALPLIQIAFERTVELKGKLSFAYINGILSNWYKKDIKTPAQALKEITSGGQNTPEKAGATDASYDMYELENMIAGGDLPKGKKRIKNSL